MNRKINVDQEILFGSFSMSEMAANFSQHQVVKGCSCKPNEQEMEMEAPAEEMPC